MKAIDRLNFERPTPIQKESIPIGIRGDDIIAVAQTGSGKTLAFGIPMLQRLSKSKRGTGLVVVPTRELALQVEESIHAVSGSVNIRSAVLIGGASMSVQRNVLKKNPRVIIATPGRLMDHLEKKTVDLSRVEVFVLDEADRMLDMGFIPDIKKIMKSIPDQRQTMLFSATMPKEIEAIAEKLMRAPTRIEIDRSGATPAEVSHEMFIINKQDKSRLLALQLKQCSGPVLVFTKTKWMAKKLTAKVNNMGFATAQIHSNRSQEQRRSALEGFRRGRYQILIATDIAARGIDVSGIELVVNYDMPANSEDYVHRIGRTGRAGKTGHAVSFATADQEGSIRNIERFIKTELAISAPPTLPSEMRLPAKADQPGFGSEPSKGEKSSKRDSQKDSPSARRSFNKRGPRKLSAKRTGSKQKESKREDSHPGGSKRRVSTPQRSQPAKLNQDDTKGESPFWTNFKKHRPARKKSAGQGSGRKNRSKRR
ncbi:MAG: DEAD/DEAH box helicase [candidate division Zixibacteria bacterium]|nr:DEAD/DEAH box helicase [candidate division Zixibacteria bacterium]MDH3936236.1 DEAD/DEAH box helicase [candidate division Zixibacteria bacterium]